MPKIPECVVKFLLRQGFVIVSTVGKKGMPHNACKGIVEVDRRGRVYLLDLYLQQTYRNLKGNPKMSITSVNEHSFKGYCLKGKAKIIGREELKPQVLKAWEDKVSGRITQRMIKNLHEEKGHPRHPESRMPKPEYMVVMEVEEIADLTPAHLKEGESRG